MEYYFIERHQFKYIPIKLVVLIYHLLYHLSVEKGLFGETPYWIIKNRYNVSLWVCTRLF